MLPFLLTITKGFWTKKTQNNYKTNFLTYQTCQNNKNMKNTKIDQGDLRSIIVNNYDMVLMLVVEEIVVSLIEKMVVNDRGARCGLVVRLRMKEWYIRRSGFDADEELLWWETSTSRQHDVNVTSPWWH